jgi:ABC-2 type transport system permease protein
VRGMFEAEWLKLRTTRAFYGLIAGAAGVAALGAFSTVASAKVDSLTGPLHEQTFWVLASVNIGLFALILGIRSYTEEYRHGTIVHTLFADPHRRRSAAAKAAISAGAAAVLAAVATVVMIGIALAMAAAKGGNLALGAADIGAFGGLLGASALWAGCW